MARIRSIKPEFWQDELVASWPAITRLAYIALWNEADDEGRLRANPVYLRSTLFPYDPAIDMAEVLGPIIEAGRLVLYVVDGQTYGHLPKFLDHQSINKPSASRLPVPPASGRTPGGLPEPYRKPPEGSRGERKGKEQGKERKGVAREGAPPAGAGPLPLGETCGEPCDGPPTAGMTVSALVEAWNELAPPECPRVRELSSGRRKRAAVRLREHPDPAYWRRVLERMASSPFLRGQNDRGWRADFDWLLQPDSAAKLGEGKYDDRKPAALPARVDPIRELWDSESRPAPPPLSDEELAAHEQAVAERSRAEAFLARLPQHEVRALEQEARQSLIANGGDLHVLAVERETCRKALERMAAQEARAC